MSIGYACLTIGVKDASFKSCTLKNASAERILELTGENLIALENIIDYNIKAGVRLFRISSDIIPFGSKIGVCPDWQRVYGERLRQIGKKAVAGGMRLSMHPGQYTVLNSPDAGVVDRAVADLAYHSQFMDSLGLSAAHKLILHIGGVYGNKAEATERFCENYQRLDENIKKRLVIENDDRLYTAQEVLAISRRLAIPVVFDNLHHQLNHSGDTPDELALIKACARTWTKQDGRQKIHYSQGAEGKRPGSHSQTINLVEFLDFYKRHDGDNLDIMLEVKDKNLSAVKCINGTKAATEQKIKLLEIEWSRYKYSVLEHSPAHYQAIRALLKDKTNYPVEEFYQILDEGLAGNPVLGQLINALEHVWGYFKDVAAVPEKNGFQKDITELKAGRKSLKAVKSRLYRLAGKYNRSYLLDSYYFFL